MIKRTGVPTLEDVMSRFPSRSVLSKPKAIIECYERIPCNPCETSCPFHAITIGDNINDMPKINDALCSGCGMCISSCPGLAIFTANVINFQATLTIPYEMHPIPNVGDIWDGVNRSGEVVTKVFIKRVINTIKQDHTVLVSITFDATYLFDVITIWRRNE